MTDTMGRMHSDAQFAGSSSVPAHVEMMGFLGIGNNPMVGNRRHHLSSENPPINGALPVRAQRFLQTDNDLQQSSEDGGCRRNSFKNFGCRLFSSRFYHNLLTDK